MIWYKDNKPLKDDYRVDIYNNRGVGYLEICDAKLDDSGDYAIFSTNSLNTILSLTRVIVNVNTKKTKRPNIEGLLAYSSR
jgi:hypothetical protein